MTFAEKLAEAVRRNESLVCVGLDPDPDLMAVRDVVAFNRAIIEATADLVCAYKPNYAFYEALGTPGIVALEKTRALIPAHLPVILDAKRGDIGNTSLFSARAAFDTWSFDALTVNPYLGRDALDPFLGYRDRGVLVLCHTSNPGSRDFQDLQVTGADGVSRPLYEVVALAAREWNAYGNVGLVVGATYPAQLARLRALCPEMTFLVPGVGAQGGELEAVVRHGLNVQGAGLILNSSRQVLYASRSSHDFAEAARAAALRLRDAINALRPTPSSR
ncbi:MAG: orotidine-5'-phosphate decarboxylase [Chloroflexi bacterium]|nr:orotidine-5'-phosphate decarboxylase [Chloroflexota bacterium]